MNPSLYIYKYLRLHVVSWRRHAWAFDRFWDDLWKKRRGRNVGGGGGEGGGGAAGLAEEEVEEEEEEGVQRSEELTRCRARSVVQS